MVSTIKVNLMAANVDVVIGRDQQQQELVGTSSARTCDEDTSSLQNKKMKLPSFLSRIISKDMRDVRNYR